MDDLVKFGWGDFFASQLSEEEKKLYSVARIVEPLRGMSRAVSAAGEIWAEGAEKVHRSGAAVGDWVLGDLRDYGAGEKRLTVRRILDRKNKLSRNATGGKRYEQILAANVDVVFIVIGLNQQINLSSIERTVGIVKDSHMLPVIVLTKEDCVSDTAGILKSIEGTADGVFIHFVSVLENRGVEALLPYFDGGNTVVLMGASGAGKSTLVNYLTQVNSQRVDGVRESDQKGRHTTTGRRLACLPSGGMVIDSPGIRELQAFVAPVAKARKRTKPERSYSPADDDEDY